MHCVENSVDFGHHSPLAALLQFLPYEHHQPDHCYENELAGAVDEKESGEARSLIAPVSAWGVIESTFCIQKSVVGDEFVCVWHKQILLLDSFLLPLRSFEVDEVGKEPASFVEVLGINSVCDDDGRSNLARWKNHTEKSCLIELLDERQSCKLSYNVRSIHKYTNYSIYRFRWVNTIPK